MRRLPFAKDVLSRMALVGVVLLVALSLLQLVTTIFGDPRATVGPRLSSPAWEWIFGTDRIGRSLLPRVIEGMRTTFFLSVVAVSVATAIGMMIGMLSGFIGGIIDQFVVRVADVFFSFPPVLLAILMSAVLGPGTRTVVIAIIFITVPLMVRVVRGATLLVGDRDFVTSSQVGGASVARILFVHIAPNVLGAVVVQAVYAASIAMLTEGALSFLGFGVQPPLASLGSLVQGGAIYLTIAPWLSLIPGLFLAVAILCTNLLGDGLRDRIDPRAARLLT